MEKLFGNCVGVKRQNDGSPSMSLGHGKRSRTCSENVDISDILVSLEAELDAFECPAERAEEGECQKFLTTTMELLDAAKTNCMKLQDQLRDKEGYYLKRENELQEFHCSELEREKEILARNQYFAHKQSVEFKAELEAKDKEIAEKNQELCAAEEREFRLKEEVLELHITEEELHDKLKRTENSFATLLKVATKRAKQWQELEKLYTNGVESLRASENRERELRKELNLARDEMSVLRSSDIKRDRSSSSGASITSELSGLESEGDCLPCVLEIKQKKISKLMKRNRKLVHHAEENAVLTDKVSELKSSQEMLKSELELTKALLRLEREMKSEKEKDFLRQIENMKAAYNLEKEQRKHLSSENEALQYQLKQRSEEWQAAMNTTLNWVKTSTLCSERDEELAVIDELDD